MDTTYGVLCLIPPIVAIGLALWTKQTIFSLFIAVWLGSTMMNGFNPLVGFVKIISDYMIPSLSGNASLIILVKLSGGMIAMLRTTGAAEAFATRVTKVINTAKKGQIVTCLSAFIFSYTEPCLMLGTIMRPVTDMVRISRAKLAYILDSMGCNLAALSPISSYGPFITGLIAAELLASGVEGNEWGIWLNMLPFNLYGVFAMISVLIVAAFGLNFGPMYKEEKRARETGKLLGDGILTDSMGRTVSFKNTIVVMTSNLTGPQTGKPGLGFTPDCADVRAQTVLREAFSPEFLGRIDCVASFRPLAAEDLAKIAALQLRELAGRLQKQNVTLETAPELPERLGALCANEPGGARSLRRRLQTGIEGPAAELLLRDPSVRTLRAVWRDGDVFVEAAGQRY